MAGVALAQSDDALVRITSYEGHVATSFQSDAARTVTPLAGQTGLSTREQKQTDLRLETEVMAHGYVYHPKFLALDVGAGLIEAASTSQIDGVTGRTREPLYNWSMHGSVLAEKPLHGSFFYDHINSTPSIDARESFNQTNNRYGLMLALMAPLSPIDLDLGVTRDESKGTGLTRLLDDQIDRVDVTARRALGQLGSLQASYHALNQTSRSGSAGLPLDGSHQEAKTLTLDSRLRLGAERDHDLNAHAEYSEQRFSRALGSAPKLDDLRLLLDYRGRPEIDWSSYANLQSTRSHQNGLASLTDSAGAGTTWAPSKSLDLSASVRGSNTQATQLASSDQSIDGLMHWERPLPLGALTLNYAVRQARHDQSANAILTAIVGEKLQFNQTDALALARSRVGAGSVVVHNLQRTQIYVQDLDYTLEVVGTATRLRRLLSGNILDGEEVLVDYAIELGGSYASTQWDQNLGLAWTLSRSFNVFARVSRFKPVLTAGQPTSALIAVTSRVVGLRATVPLSAQLDMALSGNAEREHHDESLAPYVRTEADLYLRGELPLGLSNQWQAGVRRQRVDAENVAQRLDQSSYELTAGFQLGNGLNVSGTALLQRDTAGGVLREQRTSSARGLWRFRRVSASLDVARTVETQGAYVRARTVGRLGLRRDF